MPKVGDKIRGREINKRPSQMYIWHACIDCGKERWVTFRKGEAHNKRCRRCKALGSLSPMWTGGKRKAWPYIRIRLLPNDFFYQMVDSGGTVAEHRLIMAKYLGRNLHRWEIVHHKNGNKTDNRIENLQLVTDDRHKQITILEMRITYLETILRTNGIKFNGCI